MSVLHAEGAELRTWGQQGVNNLPEVSGDQWGSNNFTWANWERLIESFSFHYIPFISQFKPEIDSLCRKERPSLPLLQA